MEVEQVSKNGSLLLLFFFPLERKECHSSCDVYTDIYGCATSAFNRKKQKSSCKAIAAESP